MKYTAELQAKGWLPKDSAALDAAIQSLSASAPTGQRALQQILTTDDYRVAKMKFKKKPKGGPHSPLCGDAPTPDSQPHRGLCGPHDKTFVIYNGCITLKNIPLEAYDYIVNGKPALELASGSQITEIQAGNSALPVLGFKRKHLNPRIGMFIVLRKSPSAPARANGCQVLADRGNSLPIPIHPP